VLRQTARAEDEDKYYRIIDPQGREGYGVRYLMTNILPNVNSSKVEVEVHNCFEQAKQDAVNYFPGNFNTWFNNIGKHSPTEQYLIKKRFAADVKPEITETNFIIIVVDESKIFFIQF
jgi:hypothetical protein